MLRAKIHESLSLRAHGLVEKRYVTLGSNPQDSVERARRKVESSTDPDDGEKAVNVGYLEDPWEYRISHGPRISKCFVSKGQASKGLESYGFTLIMSSKKDY